MRHKIVSSILVVFLIGLTIIMVGSVRKVPAKPAKSGCSNASLRGSYGLHATGTTPGGPLAIVGVISYDGTGGLTGTLFVRRTGSTSTEVVPLAGGTYTVNPDCTVSDTFGNSQHESVIVDGGRGYVILNTTEGAPVVISGDARKQFSEDSQ
jgi:hypothetical protein